MKSSVPGPSRATVYIVDDDPSGCEALGFLLRSVGLRSRSCSRAREFFEIYRPDEPGCLLLEVRLPEVSGLRLQRMLQRRRIDLPVVLMSAYADVAMAVEGMRQGAVDFLEKPFDDQVLLDAVQRAVAQNAEAWRRRRRIRTLRGRLESLTPREREVMRLVVRGRLNKQIAAELGISVKTVEIHRARVMRKMKADDLPRLVKLAIEGDFLD